ncbi:hypothetical protein L6452_43864 [Arctium lappa]|uniref:Uncharacterized protein n=1 Tax=Arctium lappa TaxID=4217 RepID=A0ACB8XE31_ARCLA|nr:hypothetical protein L6452_43864 [Arctium lappa]
MVQNHLEPNCKLGASKRVQHSHFLPSNVQRALISGSEDFAVAGLNLKVSQLQTDSKQVMKTFRVSMSRYLCTCVL